MPKLHLVDDSALVMGEATNISRSGMERFFTLQQERQGFFARFANSCRHLLRATAHWLPCVGPSTPNERATSWARDAHRWTCNYLYSEIFDGTNLSICGYAESALAVVKFKVSKAALRLASCLNVIVAGNYNMNQKVILRRNPISVLRTGAGA